MLDEDGTLAVAIGLIGLICVTIGGSMIVEPGGGLLAFGAGCIYLSTN